MFDIGFTELLLVSIVGLLVLGPERLPGAIRTGSLWLGQLRRSFNNIRTEIEREINAEDIKREIHKSGWRQEACKRDKEILEISATSTNSLVLIESRRSRTSCAQARVRSQCITVPFAAYSSP